MTDKCFHKTLKRQLVGEQSWYRCVECPQKFLVTSWDGKVEVESADFPGTCCLCGSPIFVKDDIQRWTVNNNPVAAHKVCVDENMRTGAGV